MVSIDNIMNRWDIARTHIGETPCGKRLGGRGATEPTGFKFVCGI
jgi:hypothetical protein